MSPRLLIETVLVGLVFTGPAHAQNPPTAADVLARADEAASAPLFTSDDPLVVTLAVDFQTLKKERPDSLELEGTLRIGGGGPPAVEVPVKVRTRGNFRRASRNCSFPPLRLNVPKKAVKGTVFEGQDKLKLVSPCRERRDSYQELVLEEYLVYRSLQLFTPACYRVRLLQMTYEDTSGKNEPFTAFAFVIEDDEAMAARNRAVLSEWERFHPASMDAWQAAMVDLFQYMIGNTDWSAPLFHNVDMVRDDQGRYLVVPYDFDFAGIVDAPYASPDPQIPIRNVRERNFRGFCRDDVDYDALASLFLEKRPELSALWSSFEMLDEGARRSALDYLETFYRVIESPSRYERQIVRACRKMPG